MTCSAHCRSAAFDANVGEKLEEMANTIHQQRKTLPEFQRTTATVVPAFERWLFSLANPQRRKMEFW
jgi:hypothetical protein